jgi:hypothetical protein
VTRDLIPRLNGASLLVVNKLLARFRRLLATIRLLSRDADKENVPEIDPQESDSVLFN